jgi:hypothetical protein
VDLFTDPGLGPVHQACNRGSQEALAVPRYHDGRDQRGPVVGGLPSRTAADRDRDADERRQRRNGVAAVVPCIRAHDLAPDFCADGVHPPEEHFLHQHDEHEDGEREGRRRVVRSDNLADRLDRDRDGRAEQHEGDHRCRQRFRLAVAKRVVGIGVPRRDPQSAPDDRRRENVGGRFDAVGDQRVRVSQHPGEDLDDRQAGVDQEAELRAADAAGRQ